MAEEVFSLSRLVRTFGTERHEGERYLSFLRRLARISVRQAAAYFMYLTTASALYYITKVSLAPVPEPFTLIRNPKPYKPKVTILKV